MTSLHQYEAWLDELDKQLQVEGGNVVCKLGSGLVVPMSEFKHVDDVARWAAVLEECLSKHESYIPHDYLVKRYARLVKESTRLRFDADEIAWEAIVGYRRK
jgi:hypothetical protein